MVCYVIFFFKQKTAYEMHISDWSSDVCSSDLNAIVMALYHRDARGGKGQVIDAALLSPLMMMMSHAIMMYDQLGIDEKRTGNRSTANAPRNIYRTKDDKWISVAGATTPLAKRIMEMVGRPELANEP